MNIWFKVLFVVASKKILSFWNEKIADLGKLAFGPVLYVHIYVSSRRKSITNKNWYKKKKHRLWSELSPKSVCASWSEPNGGKANGSKEKKFFFFVYIYANEFCASLLVCLWKWLAIDDDPPTPTLCFSIIQHTHMLCVYACMCVERKYK